jgi:hypothetical protein
VSPAILRVPFFFIERTPRHISRSERVTKREFLHGFARLMGAAAATPLMIQPGFAAAEALSAPPSAVQATVPGGRQTWSHNVFRTAGLGNQCTAYALDKMYEATGKWMKVRSSAQSWANEAKSAGWTVGSIPAIKSVLVMPAPWATRYTVRRSDGLVYITMLPPPGHVAWVEKVEGDWVFVSDQNWKRDQVDSRWIKWAGSTVSFIYSDR